MLRIGVKPQIIEILMSAERGGTMISFESVIAIAGSGLSGDRYAIAQNRNGDYYQVTLIEIENITQYNSNSLQAYTAADMRRNLVTQGVRLNEFVGKRFLIGDEVMLDGLELCEPCSLLANRTHSSIVKGLLHRGGLRARIVSCGEISVGDSISLS